MSKQPSYMETSTKKYIWSAHKEWPMKKKDNCIILNKCIYGLVQAAWQYYKKALEILKSSGFKGGSIIHASMSKGA